MVKPTHRLAAPLWILLLGCSCGDGPTSPTTQSPSFPPGVGSRWVYDVYEERELPPGADTLITTMIVTIVGTDTIPPGRPATVWVYERRSRAESLYVTAENDTVLFHRRWAPGNYSIVDRYILPLQVGASWDRPCGRDSVESIECVWVPGGMFPQAYRIMEWWGCVNWYGRNTKWLDPEVGLVQYERQEHDLSAELHERWNLVRSDLRP